MKIKQASLQSFYRQFTLSNPTYRLSRWGDDLDWSDRPSHFEFEMLDAGLESPSVSLLLYLEFFAT
ncbi:MAG: hypothetical protein IGS49_15400 [Chlorogloeopsis fritschii C42_A2020_084]|jgi:hypothetical protein|uniref:hypothetical protein n=1 Tax=Chlorogloeopsis fritschii TaxID=1124 RepID=UPI001A047643|nr:hypothetical protein [Chlorogloeopsis fritschii]MBF2006809.1 hypothetical protein [Chlorogloeopsis fritschii C42_A2020_084]